jgi:hypothetical protein
MVSAGMTSSSEAAEVAPAVSGYTLVLPAGWRRIPVQHGSKAAVRAILDEVFARYPDGTSRDEVIRHRVQLEGRLTDMVRRARSSGGIDLYLPVEYVHGTAVPASFVVSRVALGEPGDGRPADPAQVLAHFVAGAGNTAANAAPAEVDGVACARTETVAAPDPGQDVPLASRRADYVVPLPGQPGQWLIITFSTVGDGDPDGDFAKLLVELFDAIMVTFRWSREALEEKPA